MLLVRLLLTVALLSRPVAAAPEPIVVLVGLDGFRWDYLQKYHPPNLSKLAADGVRAKRMIPSFPSLTFPNFYTLVTGLHPEHHGIVSNNMFDPVFRESFSLQDGPKESKWWNGEPIWVTAQKQGLRAACMFWPGSEAEIEGIRPWRWLPYRMDFPIASRVQTVERWLALPAKQRPRLITIYFHEVDTASHRAGVGSPEVAAAVAQVDEAIGELVAGVRRLGLESAVNFIVVADHGMINVTPKHAIALGNLVPLESVRVDFAGAVAGLRPVRGTVEELYAEVVAKQRHFRAYRREEIPERLHFRASRRIPPVVLVADPGWTFVKIPPSGGAASGFVKGMHGFDPALRSMGATFIASGPLFKSGITIPPFENVDVYDLLCATLGLKPAPNDGSGDLAKQVLK